MSATGEMHKTQMHISRKKTKILSRNVVLLIEGVDTCKSVVVTGSCFVSLLVCLPYAILSLSNVPLHVDYKREKEPHGSRC